MRIVTADHQPVGADAFRDVRQCGIVRAEREIKIAEAFSGAAPRLLSRGRAGVAVISRRSISQGMKPTPTSKNPQRSDGKRSTTPLKISAEMAVKTSEWKTETDIQVESSIALNT